jgi:small-conductance mechanosensitive channel
MFSASLFASVVQGAIFIVGIITVLGQFGIAIAPLLTTLGLGGLAVAIALRDTLSNLFSGIHIVSSRQIRPGDFIKFDIGIEGEILDIKWRTTMIRNLQNTIVIVPNEKIAASSFTNYTMSAGDTLLPVTATLAWKGSYERLRAIAARAACEATAEFAGMAEIDRCYVDLTAVNETNLQITAYMPLSHVQDRYNAATAFLRRVYDDALAAGMGVAKESQ